MTKELRDKWVEALRSGRYQQGKGHLHAGECFCALGVLCDVLGLEWVPCEEIGDDLNNLPVYMAAGESTDGIPDSISEKIGLEDVDHAAVAIRNDSGDSFTGIADWIEAHVSVVEAVA
mgnify:CR=1 FL=1